MNQTVYRQYDQAALDAQYNNQRTVAAADYAAHMKRYADDTTRAKRIARCVEDLRFMWTA